MTNTVYFKQFFLQKMQLIGFSCILSVSLSSCAINKPCDALCVAQIKCNEIEDRFGRNLRHFKMAKNFQPNQIVRSYCQPGKGIVLPPKAGEKPTHRDDSNVTVGRINN
jgi:hypothetical protein